MARHLPTPCQELADLQQGVIARWQVAAAGINVRVIDSQLRNGRWQTLYQGVYATYTGQPSRMGLLWAAVLRGGPGAALSYQTAAELDGLIDRPGGCVHVTVGPARRVAPAGRETRQAPKIIFHRCDRLDEARHPVRLPPRTKIEETTIDLVQASPSLDKALAWLMAACGRRLTTTELLLAAMSARRRLRWRVELTGALTDIDEGVHSPLEWRYVHRVERPHRLPSAKRQAISRAGGRTRYLDNHYREYALAVELDGQIAHPTEARWLDARRDNASATKGIVTLRYGWADVTEEPCRVAAEIANILRSRGWPGRARACRPGCPAARS